MPPRPRPYRLAALSISILIVFILASLVPLKLLKHINTQHGHHVNIFSDQANSTHYSFRLVGGQNMRQSHRQLLMARFRIRSGALPVTHPSMPYLVRIDEETGAFVRTIEYGRENHPLSWLADVREERVAERESIFFFIVPKASGGKMKTIMTKCYNLRRTEKREDPESLNFIDGKLNIDTQTRNGLANARQSNIVDKGLVDVFATSYFFEGTLLFKPDHKGRAFTILRHPVNRVESLYHSRGPSAKSLNLQSYLESPDYNDNWVVRSLTNDKKGELTEEHLLVAKGILASKFVVGIDEYFEETLKRLEMYYEWGTPENKECVNRYLNNQRIQDQEMPSAIESGSDEWNMIASHENYDLTLYYYGLELFVKQGSTLFNRPYVDKTGKEIDWPAVRRKENFKRRYFAMFGRLPDEELVVEDEDG